MDSIKINTGEKRICINDDPNKVIIFNPSDVTFAERFYSLIGELETKLQEYKKRGEILDNVTALDSNDIPINLDARLALLRETCEYMRSKIDILFGADTSQKAFGDAMVLEMFEQFFTGITPYIQSVRAEKIAKYSNPVAEKKRKRVAK